MSAQRTGQRGSLKLRLRMPTRNPDLAPVPTPSPAVRRPLSTTSAAQPQPLPAYVPGEFSPSWLHNPEDTNLIRAGYKPGWNPKDTPTTSTSTPSTSKTRRLPPPPGMAEPRARAARHKGQMNFSSERRFSSESGLQSYIFLKRGALTLISSTTTSSRLR